MRTTKTERIHAAQLAAEIDKLIRDPDAPPGQLAQGAAGLLDTGRRLARLPALLGPVDPALEQQVMRRVRTGVGPGVRPSRLRPGWAVAGLTALLVVAMLLTPLGQTAVASFMAVFSLGRTEVRITPVDSGAAPLATAAAQGAAVKQRLSLEEAQAQVAFTIRQPDYLPAGYRLRTVNSYSYPDLPAWLPQPFFVELVYGDDGGHTCALRLYPIMFGKDAGISGMNLEATDIQEVKDVDVSGRPGVLLHIGSGRSAARWQEVVWEQDDLILALSATDLDEAELLRVARSVHPTPILPPAPGGD